jgi:DNA-binding LytR/AlgR family response regulator
MKQNCLIIDDNETAAEQLKGRLETVDNVDAIYIVSKPGEARAILRSFNATVIYIRIGLWDIRLFDGFQRTPLIVFLSTKTDHYMEAVHGQLDFHLAEPFTHYAVAGLQDRIGTYKGDNKLNFLFVRKGRRWRKVPFASIDMVERHEKGYVTLHTTPAKYMLYGSLQHWLNKLPQDKFIRISDQLILPSYIARLVNSNEYTYKGRKIELTFRFAEKARKELKEIKQYDWQE